MKNEQEKTEWMQKPVVVWLGAMLCCFLWGSAFPCIKIGYKLWEINSLDTASQILFAGMRFLLADSTYEDLPGGLRIPEIHPVINRPFIVYGGLPVFFQESPQFQS